MKHQAIREHSRRYPIRLMCRALAVSPAGYYAWRDRPESRRSVYNRALLSTIRVIRQESPATYSSPSIWDALIKKGHAVGEHGITTSMSRKGNCWDNACAESFFGTLKGELIYHRQYRTRDEATQDIFEYIAMFYNNGKRRHSTLGCNSSAEFEARTAVA